MPKSPYQQLANLIGYHFKDDQLLKQALTHKSVCPVQHNQRLEFLGDALLNIIVTRQIFTQYPQANEGSLSQRRANIIQGTTLTKLASCLQLDRHLNYAKDIPHVSPNMMEDSLEALIGAIYLDSNLKTVNQVVTKWLNTFTLEIAATNVHPKTLLQEKLQLAYKIHPHYNLKHHDVAKHWYTVELSIGAPRNVTYQASGSSRKALEKQLAQQALLDL